MVEKILFGIAFFLFTLFLQYLLHKKRKSGNMGKTALWTGMSSVVGIAALALVTGEMKYVAALVGFAIADEIGKGLGWHE